MSTAPSSSARHYQCPWCGRQGDGSTLTCPACGASVDVREAVTDSGWTELPPIKDMTKVQFGKSFCQIEGKYVPVADFNLAAGDGLYFAHHLLLWKDDQTQITRMPLKGGFKRLFAGMPLIMMQANGPGRIAFSKDMPGEVIALPLQAGQSVDVREHVFMVATHSVAYDWFQPADIWYRTSEGKDSHTHYPLGYFMDRFAAGSSPGLLLLHGAGNVFVRTLAPGQSILIKPTALLFKDPSVGMRLHIEIPRQQVVTWRTWAQRYIWVRMTGPGRIAVQSHFARLEDSGMSLTRTPSSATQHTF